MKKRIFEDLAVSKAKTALAKYIGPFCTDFNTKKYYEVILSRTIRLTRLHWGSGRPSPPVGLFYRCPAYMLRGQTWETNTSTWETGNIGVTRVAREGKWKTLGPQRPSWLLAGPLLWVGGWDFKNSQQQCQADNAGVRFVCRLSILPRNILLPPPRRLCSQFGTGFCHRPTLFNPVGPWLKYPKVWQKKCFLSKVWRN